ncbi:MAG: hypothetical protein Q8L86_20000 [Vicinamibacterales bacterium]|nr:hypothetical protein [Vicinamibacterales bacterium]
MSYPALRTTLGAVTGAALLALAAACGSAPDTAPPVASLDLTMSRARIALGSPVDMQYRFTVAPDAPTLGATRVFVHFLDVDEELMWTDDHEPPTPVSSWKPGDVIEYERTLFAPVWYPYVGPGRIVVGLYNPEDNARLPLSGVDRGDRSYTAAEIELLPQTENVFLIFKDGWHPAEVASDNPSVEWQWMKKEATIDFRNPRADAVLYFRADNPAGVPAAASQVELRIGETVLATVPVGTEERPIDRIPISAAQLGESEMVELRLVADRTFVPALESGGGSDTRELGARVFNVFLQPK